MKQTCKHEVFVLVGGVLRADVVIAQYHLLRGTILCLRAPTLEWRYNVQAIVGLSCSKYHLLNIVISQGLVWFLAHTKSRAF